MQRESTEIDDGFGHWLAGFADGEGSFNMREDRGHGCFQMSFTIVVRCDDRAILDELHRRTGVGRVKQRSKAGHEQRYVTWLTSDKRGCLALVDLFDRYPLRAKKARDYAIWRQGVIEWASVDGNGPGRRRQRRDWSHIRVLRDRLHAVRAYQEVPCENEQFVSETAQAPLWEG
jgi:hypothetical protein